MNLISRIKNKVVYCRNFVYKYRESKQWKNDNDQITHVTYCAVGNTGDTMLSQCVRKVFEKYLGSKKWKIFPVTEEVTDRSLTHINQSKLLVIGGGGLFIADTNKNSISGWQWPISKEQLNVIKAPIIVFSVGYNYFRGQEVPQLFKDNLVALVQKSSFIGLRNTGSVNAIKELLPLELKGKIVYQPCTTTLISQIYHIQHCPYNRTIAFNIAFDRMDKRFGDKKEIILREIAKSAKQIQNKNFDIIYVAHMKDDLLFLPFLKEADVRFVVKDISNYLPQQTIEFYRKIDVVIGMRGHAQMIPFGINCGIITLGSHDKMRWFLEDIGCVDLYVELMRETEFISSRIAQIFEDNYLGGNFDRTISRLKECQIKLMKITNTNMKIIKKIYEQGERS